MHNIIWVLWPTDPGYCSKQKHQIWSRHFMLSLEENHFPTALQKCSSAVYSCLPSHLSPFLFSSLALTLTVFSSTLTKAQNTKRKLVSTDTAKRLTQELLLGDMVSLMLAKFPAVWRPKQKRALNISFYWPLKKALHSHQGHKGRPFPQQTYCFLMVENEQVLLTTLTIRLLL